MLSSRHGMDVPLRNLSYSYLHKTVQDETNKIAQQFCKQHNCLIINQLICVKLILKDKNIKVERECVSGYQRSGRREPWLRVIKINCIHA